jgi:hypothetical protein
MLSVVGKVCVGGDKEKLNSVAERYVRLYARGIKEEVGDEDYRKTVGGKSL